MVKKTVKKTVKKKSKRITSISKDQLAALNCINYASQYGCNQLMIYKSDLIVELMRKGYVDITLSFKTDKLGVYE